MTGNVEQHWPVMFRHCKTKTTLILLCLAVLLAIRIRQGQSSRARFATGFAAVKPGMTHDEVENRLGMPPSYQQLMLGRVDSPTQFASNSNPLPQDRHQYQQFDFRQWTTRDLTAMVIFDLEGRVVCKYSAAGQSRWPRNLYELLRIF